MVIVVCLMVVVVVNGNFAQGLESVQVVVAEVDGGFEGVCEEAGAACGGGSDAVEELKVRWLLHVHEIHVKAEVLGCVCHVLGFGD